MTALNRLVKAPYKGKTYADFVHFVHVYTIEAHPKDSTISPYSGKPWPMQYSTKDQPRTYAERVANARAMEQGLTGHHLLLVDDLTPRPFNNPVWCTYGTCPNCSFLIRQDGRVAEVLVRTPRSNVELERAVKKLLEP